MVLLAGALLAVLLGSFPVTAGSLRDIEHVVIFMQENRSWDTVCPHLLKCLDAMIDEVRDSTLAPWPVCAGSMTPTSKSTMMDSRYGTSEFKLQRSPAIHSKLTIARRQVDPNMSTKTSALLPWYLGYKGGDWIDAIQCMAAGDNGYQDNQAALNYGLNNHWARNNTPWSWGYFKRDDIPVQFAIAEGWTSGDMYQVCYVYSFGLMEAHPM